MKMPKAITDKLTTMRNKADQVFCFYRIDDEDMLTVYSKGEIEDTIVEKLADDEALLEMFEVLVEEARDYRSSLN